MNANVFDELNRLGFGADIDAFEAYVAALQDAAGLGTPMVDNSVYDSTIRILKEVKPDSEVLKRNWETDDNDYTDNDEVLEKYGMCSITTITSLDELYKFKATLDEIGHPVDIVASVKEDGHGVRAVYKNGHLVSGSTRGRYKRGRDITRHLKAVLPNYVEQWKDKRIVEVRGEMLVSKDTFEKYLKGTRKTPLSSVTSLIRDSVTDEELKYLEMVCYKVISSDDDLGIETLWDEFKHLQECGFKTPEIAKANGVTRENLDKAVNLALGYFEKKLDNGELKYMSDGLVFAINNHNEFYGTGKTGNAWNGNFALKMGKHWEQNVYSAEIREVVFIPGKSYMTPKAVIEPVTTANGTQVSNVPLYNIGVMERYNYVPGETIYFRYGGETGVTTCDVYGESVRLLSN